MSLIKLKNRKLMTFGKIIADWQIQMNIHVKLLCGIKSLG